MDEEIDDERKERINQYGSSDVYSLRRLRRELGTRLDGHAEAEAMIEYKREGQVCIIWRSMEKMFPVYIFLALVSSKVMAYTCIYVHLI
jgi:hypothetical protein